MDILVISNRVSSKTRIKYCGNPFAVIPNSTTENKERLLLVPISRSGIGQGLRLMTLRTNGSAEIHINSFGNIGKEVECVAGWCTGGDTLIAIFLEKGETKMHAYKIQLGSSPSTSYIGVLAIPPVCSPFGIMKLDSYIYLVFITDGNKLCFTKLWQSGDVIDNRVGALPEGKIARAANCFDHDKKIFALVNVGNCIQEIDYDFKKSSVITLPSAANVGFGTHMLGNHESQIPLGNGIAHTWRYPQNGQWIYVTTYGIGSVFTGTAVISFADGWRVFGVTTKGMINAFQLTSDGCSFFPIPWEVSNEQEFNAKIPKIQSRTLKYDMLNLLNHKESCDVVLRVESTGIEKFAHKCILAARSDFFKTMFYGNFATYTTTAYGLGQVEIREECNEKTLDLLLQFVYTGKLGWSGETISSGDAEKLYRLASYFQLEPLVLQLSKLFDIQIK